MISLMQHSKIEKSLAVIRLLVLYHFCAVNLLFWLLLYLVIGSLHSFSDCCWISKERGKCLDREKGKSYVGTRQTTEVISQLTTHTYNVKCMYCIHLDLTESVVEESTVDREFSIRTVIYSTVHKNPTSGCIAS